ncbi:MAG: uroporphyrinogen-III C-methyltransferase [Gammaproteobacteria bacterium]|nr:uroporphyrinogen-III C-methyltransferase [Gammaproteobacteria bacterium]
MSEQEETTDHPPGDDPPASEPGKSRGFGTALVALLSLVSLAAAGYLYWRVEGIAGSGGVAPRLADDIARLEREVAQARGMAQSGSDALQEKIADLTGALAENSASLEQVRAELSAERRADGPPDPGAWRLAEVEYLLRIANNRLLMERDTRAADQMLAAADAILEELDDYALHEIRAILAEERMALANTKTANAESIFLTLEAMKDALGGLPLKQPEYFSATDATGASGSGSTDAPGRIFREIGSTPEPAADQEPEAPGEESESFGKALQDRFYGLFEFRTRDSIAPRPLIRPEEAIYLELNLRLALERAQLAMLRGDQTLFATSLSSARQWLDEYVDPENAAMQRIAQDLDRLADLDIEQSLPDISRSLSRLLELQRRPADSQPPGEGQTE